MKFGRQQDWIKQIQLSKNEFLSGVQPTTKPQQRINNNLQEWLITGTEDIEKQSDNNKRLWAKKYHTSPNSFTLWLNHVW